MLSEVIEFNNRYGLLDGCGSVIVGLSGGADSVALFHVLRELHGRYGFSIIAVHVHHGIRGEEADRDLDFCRNLCHRYGVELREFFYDIPKLAKELSLSPEEAGRKARYDSFKSVASEYENSRIAVAHHGNDRAETVIFNMTRGTGMKGLRGIVPMRDNIIRPLLCVTKADILRYLDEIHQDYCFDSTNESNDYSRNRIRNVILPELTKINSSAVSNICSMADKMMELNDFVEHYIDDMYDKCAVEDERGILLKRPDNVCAYIVKGMIIKAISNLKGTLKDITDNHITEICEMFDKRNGRKIDIKYGITVEKEEKGIFFLKDSDITYNEYDVEVPSKLILPDGNFMEFRKILWDKDQKISNEVCTKFFDYDRIKNRLLVRNRRKDDYLVVNSAGNRKKLNRYFIDCKIPEHIRDSIFLLADGDHIMWVPGGRISEEYKITEDTKNVLCVEYGGSEWKE